MDMTKSWIHNKKNILKKSWVLRRKSNLIKGTTHYNKSKIKIDNISELIDLTNNKNNILIINN